MRSLSADAPGEKREEKFDVDRQDENTVREPTSSPGATSDVSIRCLRGWYHDFLRPRIDRMTYFETSSGREFVYEDDLRSQCDFVAEVWG